MMSKLIQEIRNSYENKIASLQQEIDRLRSKMQIVIASLQEDIGSCDDEAPKSTRKENLAAKKAQAQDEGGPTTRARLIQAIDRMPKTGFGTAELITSVNTDGNARQVNKNRALKIFKDLINEGIVETTKPRSGKMGGVYKKVVKEVLDLTLPLDLF